MKTEHPITPPRELVDRLQDLGNLDAIELAYQAGADQELEACCEWVKTIAMTKPWDTVAQLALELRAARRPKSPSLKEQALDELQLSFGRGYLKKEGADTIRRALEALPE